MKIKEFLKKSKLIYESVLSKGVVLGNQAADLDSIVSSISMAYYLSLKKDSPTSYVPIINSTKSIIKSKKECMYLLDYFSIDLEQDLLFLSEWKKDEINDVILVDHNELDMKEKDLGIHKLVSGVIDHHSDKQLFLKSSPRIIDISVGSCSTLVADLIFNSDFKLDKSVATLLLFPILSDTSNLTIRTSDKDFKIVEQLKKITEIDLNLLYYKIEKFKFDTSKEDILISLMKDYKQYELEYNTWGLSSVTFSVIDWINESKTEINKIEKLMHEKSLFFYGILSCFKIKDTTEFKRDLILFSNKNILDKIKFNLIKDVTLVERNEIHKSFGYLLYEINFVSLTRKHWHPELEKILKDL
ncbi:unnamed protein product [Brachionus calyciflorus]|uniref:DHHA2 domain-containing protein n=1 Tax=Brachionus calyciflorus TaxID=104777 RepID=A0A814P5C5_9BILA|nr:unnamed protein product [Brachionus calyciflorus]